MDAGGGGGHGFINYLSEMLHLELQVAGGGGAGDHMVLVQDKVDPTTSRWWWSDHGHCCYLPNDDK